MKPKRIPVAALPLTLVLSCVIAFPCRGDSAWGNIRGRFVWDGELPAARSFQVTKEGHTIPDDSLLVKADSRGIANIAIYLPPVKRDEVIPVHPSYAEAARRDVFLAIHDNGFTPRVAIIRTSQTLVMKNNDTIGHNPNISTLRNPGFNRALRPGDRASVSFRNAERLPIMASGNIHPWLRGYLLVMDHPYATLTDANGQFEIKHLPAGQRILSVWHERAGFITSVTLDSQSLTWDKGRATVHVQPGTYDMGDIRISSERFQRR